MRVLITGSAGFVGSAFAEHYDRVGATLINVDILNGNQHDCRDFFERSDDPFDLVIHCAAVVGGRAMIDGEPLHLAAEDLSIDSALFRWALRARRARPHLPPPRIVYFSSSAAYPPQLQSEYVHMSLREEFFHAGRCDQTYGWVKQTGERLAAEANAIGIPVHVFRPFSGYSEDQDRAYPFPAFVQRAAQREQPFDVWGRGESARDWVHIDDIVGAVLAAIDADVRGPVNICTGRATTFDELAAMVMRRVGYSTCIRYVANAPQGVHWRVGDPTMLETFYKPKISLEEGIARALGAA